MARTRAALAPEQRAAAFKALGEATRLRIVDFLRGRDEEATGTEVAAETGISLALLCHHADALVESGLVIKRKEGQTSYWRINREALELLVRDLES
jgi:DNA-binding transcriptional ArsR family regulator